MKNTRNLIIGIVGILFLCICLIILSVSSDSDEIEPNILTQMVESPIIKPETPTETNTPVPSIETNIPVLSTETLQSERPTETAGLPEPKFLSRCISLPKERIEDLQYGLDDSLPDNYIVEAYAVRSNDYKKVYFMAAYVYGPGIEDGVGPGVWARIGGLETPGLIYSVGGVANGYSDWGDGGTIDARLSLFDDGADEARKCVEYHKMKTSPLATDVPTKNCHPSYPDFCIPPPPPDLNCPDIPHKRFTVLPPDPHKFDRDKNGIGCES